MKVTQEACPEVRVAFRPPGLQVSTFIAGLSLFSASVAKPASVNWVLWVCLTGSIHLVFLSLVQPLGV